MSIVSDADINLWMGLTDGTADSTMAEGIRDEVEAYVKGFCHRDFVETTYVAEAYDGTGSKDLQLKQYPVTRVYSLATTSVNALKVYNSGSASTAFAAVISAPPAAVTGMRLTEDGADDSTDLTFATSATITAINAVVDGLTNWNAEIQGGWGAKKSNLLIATPDLYALSTNFAMFKIPDDYVTQYEVYPDEGRLSYWGGFPVGRRNIIVTYTGGYSTCPADLQEAIKIVVQEVYRLRKEDAMGLTHLQLGDLRMDFEAVCPSKALAVFKRYQRRDHWFGGQ